MGNWKFEPDAFIETDMVRWSLDFESVMNDVIRKMRDTEEKAYEFAVAKILQDKGYTVIPPQVNRKGGA